MANTTTEHKPYEWNNDFHVQFRLAGRAYHALSEEALALGTSPNIAAKLLLTQRLDKPTYEAQLRMLRDPHTYRLDDPNG